MISNSGVPAIKSRREQCHYLNVACSFDIETSSFYVNKNGEVRKSVRELPLLEQAKWAKRATMYVWGFGFNGYVTIGRTWEEFISLLQEVQGILGLESKTLRLVCFVHNLSYEFQWMRFYFDWISVFATSQRTPVKALCDMGIEFRCSQILSGYRLEKVGEHLINYPVEKLVGKLNYDLLRHSETELNEDEISYLVNDNLVVMSYIQELIEQRKHITRIPLTKTGFTREYVRNKCFWGSGSHRSDPTHRYLNYRDTIASMTMEVDEYMLAKRAFHGGFVHANAHNANKLMHEVTSMDFTSSYPAVICSEQFPMSKGVRVYPQSIDEFKKYLNLYCCIIDVEFTNLESITEIDHLISSSKCIVLENATIDNGRVVDAKQCRLAITNIDLKCYRMFYKWDEIKIFDMWIYKKNYLPRNFVLSVLDLYETKTKLKGVEGKEAEYLWSKENLNACFGMCVTDVCRNEQIYEKGDWIEKAANVEEAIKDYNKKGNRFICYVWGLFITSYAMFNLCTGLIACGKTGDFCYSDTDSIKILHAEKYQKYFDWYNARIEQKLKDCADALFIDYSKFAPKTIKGDKKMLGVWDFDGFYDDAIFLGAKRYAVRQKEKYSLTIAGVNKTTAVPKLLEKAKKEKKDFFDYMYFGFVFDENTCGKLLHTYIDEAFSGELTDYKGVNAHYEEKSCVHLEATTYEMSASDDYLDYLAGITTEDVILPG